MEMKSKYFVLLIGVIILLAFALPKINNFFSIIDNPLTLDNLGLESDDAWHFKWYGMTPEQSSAVLLNVNYDSSWKTEGTRSLKLSTHGAYVAAQAYQEVNMASINLLTFDYSGSQPGTMIISDNPCSGSSYGLQCSAGLCIFNLTDLRRIYGSVSGKYLCISFSSYDSNVITTYIDNFKINTNPIFTCKTGADTDCNNAVSLPELIAYANRWISGTITKSDLMSAASAWVTS